MTTTTTAPNAVYNMPAIGTPVPCILVSRQVSPKGRPTATIVIPAAHSKMGLDVDLTVADRSVVDACDACHVRPGGHGHFALYCEPCAALPYGHAAP